MAFFEWTDELSVNVQVIDGQHKKLVEMVNSLNEAMLAKRGREMQKTTIDAMVDYAATHFKLEEGYMTKFHYPGYETHKSEHDEFTRTAQDLKERAEKKGFGLTLEIMGFLKNWLQNHIMGTDKKYSGFFNEHGLR
jgi:hemerythrin